MGKLFKPLIYVALFFIALVVFTMLDGPGASGSEVFLFMVLAAFIYPYWALYRISKGVWKLVELEEKREARVERHNRRRKKEGSGIGSMI